MTIVIAAPSGPPQNLTVAVNDSRSLILNWDVPLPQDINGIITDYTINISSNLGISNILVGSNTTSFTLTSLRPFVAYTCVIAAHTSIGQGPFSTSMTLTTPEDVPEAPPVTISHKNLLSRSVELSWVAPRSDRQNGIIRYYIIEAYENITGNVLTYQTLADQTSFTVSSLHPYYTYTIQIAAFTIGAGYFSAPYTIRTIQDGENPQYATLVLVTINFRNVMLNMLYIIMQNLKTSKNNHSYFCSSYSCPCVPLWHCSSGNIYAHQPKMVPSTSSTPQWNCQLLLG